MKKYDINPSVIATSQEELDERLARLKPVKPKIIQLDVMDGSFVKNTSLEFEVELPKASYEAHLMVSNPHAWITKNSSFASSIIIHYESKIHLEEVISELKRKRKKIGIAINPNTPVEDIVQYIPHVNKVLVMTVNPGQYGSKFLPAMLKKIRELRERYPTLDIQVDGGITPETLTRCRDAGANQFVVGSYLQKAPDVRKAWASLQKAMKS